MNHIMVDIETTGLNPQRAAIIQIGAVKFELDKPVSLHTAFKRSLSIPQGRRWERGTAEFWDKFPEVLSSIQRAAEPPVTVMKDFASWCGREAVFWAKPTIFDWAFIDSYFADMNVQSPFNFRRVIDLQSYCKGILGSHIDWREYQRTFPFTGAQHNALDDALHQVKIAQATHARHVMRKELDEVTS